MPRASPTQQVAACDSQHTKYLLDAAKVSNTDLPVTLTITAIQRVQ